MGRESACARERQEYRILIEDVTGPDLIRKILDHVNSRAPRACRHGAPNPTKNFPISSPNANKLAATEPPVHTVPRLPETPCPPSGNGPSVREPFDRFVRSPQ